MINIRKITILHFLSMASNIEIFLLIGTSALRQGKEAVVSKNGMLKPNIPRHST